MKQFAMYRHCSHIFKGMLIIEIPGYGRTDKRDITFIHWTSRIVDADSVLSPSVVTLHVMFFLLNSCGGFFVTYTKVISLRIVASPLQPIISSFTVGENMSVRSAPSIVIRMFISRVWATALHNTPCFLFTTSSTVSLSCHFLLPCGATCFMDTSRTGAEIGHH